MSIESRRSSLRRDRSAERKKITWDTTKFDDKIWCHGCQVGGKRVLTKWNIKELNAVGRFGLVRARTSLYDLKEVWFPNSFSGGVKHKKTLLFFFRKKVDRYFPDGVLRPSVLDWLLIRASDHGGRHGKVSLFDSGIKENQWASRDRAWCGLKSWRSIMRNLISSPSHQITGSLHGLKGLGKCTTSAYANPHIWVLIEHDLQVYKRAHGSNGTLTQTRHPGWTTAG